jgi:hypothetical protein
MKSFVFTIKNPHNLPPRIFKQAQKEYAIFTYNPYGPTFGNGHTLHIRDECHTSNGSYSSFASCYPNDTGIANDQVLVGSKHFTVEEIEVFEVTSK